MSRTAAIERNPQNQLLRGESRLLEQRQILYGIFEGGMPAAMIVGHDVDAVDVNESLKVDILVRIQGNADDQSCLFDRRNQ